MNLFYRPSALFLYLFVIYLFPHIISTLNWRVIAVNQTEINLELGASDMMTDDDDEKESGLDWFTDWSTISVRVCLFHCLRRCLRYWNL